MSGRRNVNGAAVALVLVNSKSQRRRCTAVADIMENGIDGPVEITRLVLKISQTRLVIGNNAHAMHGEGSAGAGKIRMARGTSRQLEMAVEQARPAAPAASMLLAVPVTDAS